MVRLDLQYARTRSFWTDIKILLATPRAVMSGRAPVEAGGLVIGSELLQRSPADVPGVSARRHNARMPVRAQPRARTAALDEGYDA